jgi:amino-acid N-acetyltransferase
MLAGDLEARLNQNKNDFPPDMVSKAIHAAAACHAGIPRVHIINGRVDEGLLAEVFSNEGVGTLIYANEYQQVRRALKKDVRNILRLTKNSVASEELVRRTYSAIEKQVGDYFLFEIDKNPVACVALHTFPEFGKGELACLCVLPSHENQGIGRKLIQFAENKARELGLNELIALSTQAFTYFQSKAGFAEGTAEDLPPGRRERYEQSGRNSKILVKKLARTN